MTHTSYRLATSLFIVLAIVACNPPTDADRAVDLLVETDKSVYSLAADRAAQPFLINRGPVAVYAPMNEYVAVQRFEDGRWQEPHPWFAVDGTSSSFPIEPGDTLKALPMDFAYVARAPGVYRFVFEIAHDPHGRHLVSEAARTSPLFELRP